MTGFVTVDEARTVNAYFRAVKTVRDLNEVAENRYLTGSEGRKLRQAMTDVERLLPLVAEINRRTLSIPTGLAALFHLSERKYSEH